MPFQAKQAKHFQCGACRPSQRLTCKRREAAPTLEPIGWLGRLPVAATARPLVHMCQATGATPCARGELLLLLLLVVGLLLLLELLQRELCRLPPRILYPRHSSDHWRQVLIVRGLWQRCRGLASHVAEDLRRRLARLLHHGLLAAVSSPCTIRLLHCCHSCRPLLLRRCRCRSRARHLRFPAHGTEHAGQRCLPLLQLCLQR